MTWLVVSSERHPFAWNMAVDEALLEAIPRLGKPVLRFYGWTEPAASFGYFQRYSDVERLTPLRPLVRRPTGGGIVPHDADWTYSAAFPTAHEWYSLAAIESYRRIHEWIRSAFARLNTSVELAPCCLSSGPGQCFAGYEKFDVLWRGRKIAGAAQRRRKDGLLIQGSVQPPIPTLTRQDWEHAMKESAQIEQGVRWEDWKPDAALESRAKELSRQKYERDDYNRKRA